MGTEVPRSVQHVPLTTLAPSLVSAWERATGGKPSKNLLRAMVGIVWIETGHGNLVCNSPGNVSVGGFYNGTDKILAWWHGDYWRPEWFGDETHRLHAKMLAGKVPSAFAAYPTLVDGLDHWVRVLRRNFFSVVLAGQTGSSSGLVKALHDSKYSEDYKPEHAASFDGFFRELASNADYQKLEATLPGTVGSSSSAGVWLGLGAFLVAGGAAAWFVFRKR